MLTDLAQQVGMALLKQQYRLVTAESCTGGEVAAMITSIAGSSAWFERGFITYSNAAKIEMLDVSPQALKTLGAVSEVVAQQMVQGALQHSAAQIALAITGIAGPQGGSNTKPVGMVCFAWAQKGGFERTAIEQFSGERTAVRAQAVQFALQQLLDLIS